MMMYLIIKIAISLIVGVLIGWVLCIRHVNNLQKRWLYEYEMLAVPEYYRPIIGYDSIQLTTELFTHKWVANFCYPNKWRFNKYKIDSLK